MRWWSATRGDVDATVSQVGFNLAQMAIPVFLLAPFGIPLAFSVTHLLPGFALGFVVGSLGLVQLAVQLARREHRADVTTHAYGNNVPAIIAYTLSIILPVYLQSRDAELAWRVGAAAVVWTGLLKLAAAPFVETIRRAIPSPAAMTVFGAAIYSYLALVLLQRLFDHPLIGLVTLAIVATSVLGSVPITKWRIPPLAVAWLIPLAIALMIGYVKLEWHGMQWTAPFVAVPGLVSAMRLAIPYLSVIVPIAVYHVLQDIASVAGGASAGDSYDVRKVLLWDGIGTLVCGLAGSSITPELYALLPSYKGIGARISYVFWSAMIFLLITVTGLSMFLAQLFPWPILAGMLAYSSIGVGIATLRKVDTKYTGAVLLGFVLPAGAVVQAAVNSALPALRVNMQDPSVQAALNRSIYWTSVQGLGNGFLLTILVVTAMIVEVIDRRFARAAIWCLAAAAFSWVGLMHSSLLAWGAQPTFAMGWLAAALIVYSAQWWRGDA